MSYYDAMRRQAASGYLAISGWGAQGQPGLVTSGAGLSDLLAAAAASGMYVRGDELDMEHAISGLDPMPQVPAPAQMTPEMANAMAAAMVNRGLIVQNQRPTKAREYVMGFESPAAVNPGVVTSITTRPQVPFRCERLLVPSDIAGSFTILDFRVGKNSQFAANTAVPARTFQENAVGIRLQLDTAQVSQDLTINVQNIGGAPQTFRASVIGAAVE
jgi:hypothetical protein